MSSGELSITPSTSKGKARATPQDLDERTPLLASGSGIQYDPEPSAPRRRRLLAKLLSVFLFSFSICILLFILVLLIVYSYGSQASNISPDELIHRALVTRGPDRLNVLNITSEGGVWVNVHGRVGLDAGSVIGVATDDDDDSLLKDVWKSVGRWGINQLDRITVKLTTINITTEHDQLATISLPPLELPLTADPPPDETWLTKVSVPVYVLPTKNISALAHFVRESWRDGTMRVEAHVGCASVRGGRLDGRGWRSILRTIRSDVHSKVSMKIPRLPGLPAPGRGQPLPPPSELVALQSFRIESNDSQLSIYANATAVNPIPENIYYTSGRLPFTISLPAINDTSELIPIATVQTAPFSLTHPNISVSLSGHVLPIHKNASTTVSTFLANYVSARDSKVSVSTPLLPELSVNATFPALRPKPQILRDVTIRNMKIKSNGGDMLASGIVYARIVLPSGFQVDLNVTRVLPDVLIFDGPVPDDGATPPSSEVYVPPEPSLPDPLPERAFGHIRPEDWVPSTSVPAPPSDGSGSAVDVFAQIEDVPIQVLPGRDREFRNFVGKVIFSSNGAVAGVKGEAAVTVSVEGLPLEHGEMELDDLPFKGLVRIGKNSLPASLLG